LSISGCGSAQNIRGVSPTLEQTSIVSDENAQAALVNALIRKAHIRPDEMTAIDPRWAVVAEAGLYEIDRQCDQYLAALFNFNRDQRAARQGLTAAGATTAAILGLTGATGMTIALVAASFGLAATLFDAGVNSVLFTIEPSALRAVMLRGRQAYLATVVWKDVTTRPRMMIVLQGYLAQCTPAAIEANINNAATGAPSVSSSNPEIALKAAAMAAPSASVVQNPEVWVSRPASRGGSSLPPPVPGPDLAPNLEPVEKFITTKEEVRRLQRALGVAADGDLGKFETSKLSVSRNAVAGFQAGVKRHNNADDRSQGTGVVDAQTYATLATAGALPAQYFQSAFERGVLGDPFKNYSVPDPREVEFVIALLGGPAQDATATTPEALSQRIGVLRNAVAAYRAKSGGPASTILDSGLFDEVYSKRPAIPAPPPLGPSSPSPTPISPTR
jgi:hypothetical protein